MGMVALQPTKEVAARAVDCLFVAVHDNVHYLQDPVDPDLVLAWASQIDGEARDSGCAS
jgi:hypothetical protein